MGLATIQASPRRGTRAPKQANPSAQHQLEEVRGVSRIVKTDMKHIICNVFVRLPVDIQTKLILNVSGIVCFQSLWAMRTMQPSSMFGVCIFRRTLEHIIFLSMHVKF